MFEITYIVEKDRRRFHWIHTKIDIDLEIDRFKI